MSANVQSPIEESDIAAAAQLLRAGRLVAFPTETVYGLGANALDREAVLRIYRAKGRPATSPLIVHVASLDMAQSLVAIWPEAADRLASRFWPGALTLVLPIASAEAVAEADALGSPGKRGATVTPRPALPAVVTGGLSTVGLRMPAHPLALALIRAAGVPLAAPSANRFTQLSPTSALHVRQGLGTDVDFILDGGPCAVGIESTVLSLVEPQPVLLRPGAISRAELEEVVGPVANAGKLTEGPQPSPGMHPRHYSPRTPLLPVQDGKLPDRGKGTYLQYRNPPSREDVPSIQMPITAKDYAVALYERLHQADAANHDWIAIDAPPDTPEWEAIHDRLRRAAAK